MIKPKVWFCLENKSEIKGSENIVNRIINELTILPKIAQKARKQGQLFHIKEEVYKESLSTLKLKDAAFQDLQNE